MVLEENGPEEVLQEEFLNHQVQEDLGHLGDQEMEVDLGNLREEPEHQSGTQEDKLEEQEDLLYHPVVLEGSQEDLLVCQVLLEDQQEDIWEAPGKLREVIWTLEDLLTVE